MQVEIGVGTVERIFWASLCDALLVVACAITANIVGAALFLWLLMWVLYG